MCNSDLTWPEVTWFPLDLCDLTLYELDLTLPHTMTVLYTQKNYTFGVPYIREIYSFWNKFRFAISYIPSNTAFYCLPNVCTALAGGPFTSQVSPAVSIKIRSFKSQFHNRYSESFIDKFLPNFISIDKEYGNQKELMIFFVRFFGRLLLLDWSIK